ncbi:MAG: sodium/proton-translocating pyrophosphatase, partial [Candidatus Njordarchaeota archaeon]
MIVEPYLIFSIIIGVIGLIIVLFLRRWVLQQPIEDEKAREVSRWIKTGARAFLKKESTAVLGFIIGISIVLGLLAYLEILEYHILIGFVVGSLLSLGMAYLGMETATDANVRTTEAARKDSMRAFQIAYRGGAVTGLSLVSLSILGIGILFMLFESPSLVVGFGFGASLAALFAQLGGGIFTKSADIGADLVGKVEEKLEEDDPRNAAVIADLVGDNVGDCAGRASDLFESFSDNIIAIMILGSFIAIYAYEIDFKIALPFIILPITLQAIGIIANTIGVFATLSKDPTKAVRWSYIISAALVIVGFFFTIELMIGPVESYLHNDFMFSERIFLAALLGLGGSLLTVLLVNYYTGYQNKPVQEIKQAAEGGAALDILAGMSLGLESAFPEAVVIGLVMIGSFFLGAGSFTLSGIDPIKGLYGASMSVIGLLSMTGIIQTSDTFGPIVDNADGIATMAGLGDEVGTSLETLDAVGNTTKALTKAYGMAAAILTGISVLFAYITEVVREEGMLKAGDITFEKLMEVMAANIVNPLVLFGILIGAAVPFLFSAWAIKGAQRGA